MRGEPVSVARHLAKIPRDLSVEINSSDSTILYLSLELTLMPSEKIGSGRGTVGKCTGLKWSKPPFWPEDVHFGPFRSANRTLAIPEKMSVCNDSGYCGNCNDFNCSDFTYNKLATRDRTMPAKSQSILLANLLRLA